MIGNMIEIPNVGEIYYSYDKRKFQIKEVRLEDLLGREIVGTLNDNFSYSCDIKIWEEVWRDKAPRLDPSKMKV